MDNLKAVDHTVVAVTALVVVGLVGALCALSLCLGEAEPAPAPESVPRVRPEPLLSCIIPDEKLLVLWINGERLHFRESEIRPQDR